MISGSGFDAGQRISYGAGENQPKIGASRRQHVTCRRFNVCLALPLALSSVPRRSIRPRNQPATRAVASAVALSHARCYAADDADDPYATIPRQCDAREGSNDERYIDVAVIVVV